MAKKDKKAPNREESQLASTGGDHAPTAAGKPPKNKPMSASERRKNRIDGIIKTVYPSVLGTIAGFVCYHTGPALAPYPWHFVMVSLIMVTYFIQKYTYPYLNIDANAFKTKDWFYVEFMVVDMWLVAWTLLLN